jgi:single-strand DNA-binding protein
VVCWEGLAETTAKYVKKGDPLYVEGRLQYHSYQDEEGKARGVVEIVAADVQFLGRRKAEPGLPVQDDPAPPTARGDGDELDPNDVPF